MILAQPSAIQKHFRWNLFTVIRHKRMKLLTNANLNFTMEHDMTALSTALSYNPECFDETVFIRAVVIWLLHYGMLLRKPGSQ